jgi:ABC-type branched-subunit amino acid transport system substrate-binding protein
MDFYSGALLAVYDLAEEGINCNLNVFDLMDKSGQFSTDIIKNSDVVIGPVSAGDLTKVFFSAPGSNAIISPLDPRAERLVKEHPEMIHVPTPHTSQYKDLVKWIEEDFKEGDHVVMITEKGARQSNITIPVKEALDSSSLAYSPFSYSILEGRDVTEPLTALMSTAGANRIIVASESEAFVNDVVRNLNLLIFNNLDIVLYAPSKIRGFETIEVENFHNTTMHVSLGYHIDYESPEVKAFLKKYRALYNTEPTQFAFQGYDIARYFMELSAKYGDNWKEHLCDSPKEMLQSTFRFIKHGSGGYTNNGIRRIIYEKGYNIKRG